MKEVSKQYPFLFFQVQWGTCNQSKRIDSTDAKFCSHSYFECYQLKLAYVRYCYGKLPYIKWECQQNICYRIMILWDSSPGLTGQYCNESSQSGAQNILWSISDKKKVPGLQILSFSHLLKSRIDNIPLILHDQCFLVGLLATAWVALE